jgi:amino acid transporter
VIGSMVIGVVLYIALQVAYIVALDPPSLAKGWDQVSFGGKGAVFGPFAGLAAALGVGWLATLLYIDAIISPFGTGLLYVGTSARLTFGMGRDRYVPRPFALLSTRGVPLFAIAFSFLLGMIVFLPFPSWQQLVGFISSATVLAYSMAPLALGALRRQEPDRPRPYRLPAVPPRPGSDLLSQLVQHQHTKHDPPLRSRGTRERSALRRRRRRDRGLQPADLRAGHARTVAPRANAQVPPRRVRRG